MIAVQIEIYIVATRNLTQTPAGFGVALIVFTAALIRNAIVFNQRIGKLIAKLSAS
jgi:hypothetical protein